MARNWMLTCLMVVLIAAAGCTGVSDDAADVHEAEDLSLATQALWDKGLSDPYLDVEATGKVHEFDLYVHDFGTINPYGDKEVWMITLSEDPNDPGTVPGPEIRVQQGDTVRVTLHTPDTAFPGHTLHWHGYDVPWEMDGVPFVTQDIAAADTPHEQVYEFVAKQPGTYWYHCVTAFPMDLDLGLFGAFIVEPQEPELPFDRQETLIFHEVDSQLFEAMAWTPLHDKDADPQDLSNNPVDLIDSLERQARAGADVAGQIASRETGQRVFAEPPRDYYPEASPRYKPIYDVFMINGKSYPDTEPVPIEQGETLRMRLINAGQNHRSIHLHGHHVLVTHIDGYPLEHPHWEDTISLAPGERKDVYVQGTNPGIWGLHDHASVSGSGSASTNDHAFPGGMMTHLVYDDWEPNYAVKPDSTRAGDYAVYAPSYLMR